MSATGSGLVQYLRKLAAGRANGAGTDRQLLEQFVMRREEKSFTALLRRHGPMVLGVCRRVLGHEQDAEDAFQATFLVLARRAGSIRKHESIGSWLHGVAYHVAEKLRGKEARRVTHERKAVSRSAVDPADDVAWREIRCLLDSELARLPEHYRGPLVLCYLQGKTQDEAARQLDWSLRTFRRRLKCARDLLVRRLTRRGVTLSAVLSAPLLADATAKASLPPLLAVNTVRAGLARALGNTVCGIVSAQVVALAEGGIGSLLVKKASIALVLLVSLMLGIGGLLAHRAVQDRFFAEAPAAPAAPTAPSPPTHRANKDQAIETKGRVLDPVGKPFAGARLFLLSEVTRKRDRVLPHATTDKNGQFRFTTPPADFGPQGKAVLAATAKGYGLEWIDLNAKDKNAEITLRLVADDTPIEGRVLDLEGNPVAGVTIKVDSVAKRADDKDLSAFVERLEKYLKEGTPGFPNKNFQPGALALAQQQFQWKHLRPTGLDLPATATTDKNGRFRLTGFGRDRVLDLAIRGPTIAETKLQALTRSGPPNGWVRGHFGLYSCRLDYVAPPCKPIIGTVRDKRTGKPLAGISVYAVQQTFIEVKTDNQGRYRIVGAAKSKEYQIDAVGMPYFYHRKQHIADTPGLEPLVVDLELERGIVIRGRLTDKRTGKPVQGEIYYRAEPDNPHVKDLADGGKGHSGRTSPDGSFAVLAIPGPGSLRVQADHANGFVRAEVKGGALQYHAEARINPSENDPKSMACDIALEPARQLSGSVVGPDGKPLADVYAAGRWPIFSHSLLMHEKLESDSFDVSGLKAGQPRTLIFLHPDKKLGKVVKLQGDETKLPLVRLEPLDAVLTGRILDAKGRPWPGLKVGARTLLGKDVFRDKSYPPEFLWGYTAWMNLKVGGATTTDREGRFRIADLMPGLKYVLFAREEKCPGGNAFGLSRERFDRDHRLWQNQRPGRSQKQADGRRVGEPI